MHIAQCEEPEEEPRDGVQAAARCPPVLRSCDVALALEPDDPEASQAPQDASSSSAAVPGIVQGAAQGQSAEEASRENWGHAEEHIAIQLARAESAQQGQVEGLSPESSRTPGSPGKSPRRLPRKDSKKRTLGWQQPEPLELPQVWVCVPKASKIFTRCRLCVDKLGLTLLPLVAPGSMPRREGSSDVDPNDLEELLWRGAVVTQPEEDLALMTQMISLPTSAVKNIVEDSTESEIIMKSEWEGIESTPLWRRPFSRVLLVGSRIVFGRNQDFLSDASTPDAETALANEEDPQGPPHPNMVGIYVDGAVVKTVPRLTKNMLNHRNFQAAAENAKKQLRESKTPPVFLALCFKTLEEAHVLTQRLRKFRRYAFSLPSWPSNAYVPSSSPGSSPRSSPLPSPLHSPRADTVNVDRDDATMGLETKAMNALRESLRPPPLSDPNIGKRIPSLTVSNDGQTFWKAPFTGRATPMRRVQLFSLMSI